MLGPGDTSQQILVPTGNKYLGDGTNPCQEGLLQGCDAQRHCSTSRLCKRAAFGEQTALEQSCRRGQEGKEGGALPGRLGWGHRGDGSPDLPLPLQDTLLWLLAHSVQVPRLYQAGKGVWADSGSVLLPRSLLCTDFCGQQPHRCKPRLRTSRGASEGAHVCAAPRASACTRGTSGLSRKPGRNPELLTASQVSKEEEFQQAAESCKGSLILNPNQPTLRSLCCHRRHPF